MKETLLITINKAFEKSLNRRQKELSISLFEFISNHINKNDPVTLEDILFYVLSLHTEDQKDFLIHIINVLDAALNSYINREEYLLCDSINKIKIMVLQYAK